MVKSNAGEIKPRAIPQLERAGFVVMSDGASGFPEVAQIDIDTETVWRLQE